MSILTHAHLLPAVVALPLSAAVLFGSGLMVPPPKPSVRSACTLVLPIWAYIIAVGGRRKGFK